MAKKVLVVKKEAKKVTLKVARKAIETPAHMAKDKKAGIVEGSKKDFRTDEAEARAYMKRMRQGN